MDKKIQTEREGEREKEREPSNYSSSSEFTILDEYRSILVFEHDESRNVLKAPVILTLMLYLHFHSCKRATQSDVNIKMMSFLSVENVNNSTVPSY